MKELVEEKFKEIFGTEGRFKTYFVPAKVNIVEEDEDYKGEMAPKTRAKKGVCATIREREDRILNFYSVNFSEAGIISISIDNVVYNENETWVKYPKEIILSLKEKGYELKHGFDIVYYENIVTDNRKDILKILTAIVLKDMYNLDINNETIETLEQKTDEEDEDEGKLLTGEKLQID